MNSTDRATSNRGQRVQRRIVPDEAVEAIERGWAVVAMVPGTKRPYEEWQGLGFRDLAAIREAWHFGNCAVGVLTGPSHLVDIDVDGDEGQASWRKFRPTRLPYTGTVKLVTPHGEHWLYRVGNERYKTCAGQLAPGIDVRAWGGLFKVYDPNEPDRRLRDNHANPGYIAKLPEWLGRLLPKAGERPSRTGAGRDGRALIRILAGFNGSQHDALLKVMMAAQTRYGYLGREAVVTMVYEIAQALKLTRPSEPWRYEDIDGLWKDGWVPDADRDEQALLAQPTRVSR